MRRLITIIIIVHYHIDVCVWVLRAYSIIICQTSNCVFLTFRWRRIAIVIPCVCLCMHKIYKIIVSAADHFLSADVMRWIAHHIVLHRISFTFSFDSIVRHLLFVPSQSVIFTMNFAVFLFENAYVHNRLRRQRRRQGNSKEKIQKRISSLNCKRIEKLKFKWMETHAHALSFCCFFRLVATGWL